MAKIKTSSKEEQAIALLKEIEEKLEEFREAFRKLSPDEKDRVGGIVAAAYSPAGEADFCLVAAPEVIAYGLVAALQEGVKERLSKEEL